MVKSIIGKVISEYPECKKDMKKTMNIITKVVSQVNRMTKHEISEKIKQFTYYEKTEKTSLQKIMDKVPGGIKGKVVTRIPPEPNAAGLHIGHAKAMWLDRTIADIYKGKCILRWDDTNPETEKKQYITEIRKDIRILGIKWDKEVYTSDYIKTMYSLCEKLLKQKNAYVCTCAPEKISEHRKIKKQCACRNNSIQQNIALWNRMVDGKLMPGSAVVRMKGNMNSDNTAMRDPTLFRIINIKKYPHFRQGRKYHAWPLYDFASAVMDSPDTIGITHPLRSKEYELRDEVYYYLMQCLNLAKPKLINISRLVIPGYPISKRLIKPIVENKKVWGWDDPRLLTVKGLIRRGITPEAIKDFVLQFGISTAESAPTLDKLFAENRKIIDPTAMRRMFVSNPIKINIKNAPAKTVELRNHPNNDALGTRKIMTNGIVYISKQDFQQIKQGEIVRLKELYNIEKHNKKFVYAGGKVIKKIAKVQWVSAEKFLHCIVYVPGKLFDKDNKLMSKTMNTDKGICEKSCSKLKKGDMIQFERYGFVRVDKKKPLEFIFAHK